MCNCENYKKKYEELLEIEKAHKEENGRLRAKIKDLENNTIDLTSVYIDGVYDERNRWLAKIKMNEEYLGEELIDLLLTDFK